MTDNEKLSRLKAILAITDQSEDTRLSAYLGMAKDEILNWLYINAGEVPTTVTSVPTRYEQIQIQACIAGFNIAGAENQSSHNENGISRAFVYDNMLAYIHSHVVPYVKVV